MGYFLLFFKLKVGQTGSFEGLEIKVLENAQFPKQFADCNEFHHFWKCVSYGLISWGSDDCQNICLLAMSR